MNGPKQEKACQISIGGVNYYTMFGAADYLKISVRSLIRLVNAKAITYMRHERGTLFKQEWLNERLERQTIFARR